VTDLASLRPPFTASPLRVWAVEDTTAQITWGDLPTGEITAVARNAQRAEVTVVATHHGGPGSLLVQDLVPSTAYQLDLAVADDTRQLSFKTLASPAGPLLSRVATISDLHLGAERWGFLKTMVESNEHSEPHPLRCARASITEAIEWGAQLLVIKGDAAHHRHPDNFALLGSLVDDFPDLPMLLIPGNHDVDYSHSLVELPDTVGARQLPYVQSVDHVDVPGARVLVANSTINGRGEGTLAPVADSLVAAATESATPVLLAIHHHLHRHPIPTYWPPGIPKDEAQPFLNQLAVANQRTLLTSGHSHRNRSRRQAGLTITEVASTRDWPGVWAGYAIHEGGIRQVVRRAAAPDAVIWHEYSRGALLGLWDFWSPGPLDQRCFSLDW
jgi:hypothetical protein